MKFNAIYELFYEISQYLALNFLSPQVAVKLTVEYPIKTRAMRRVFYPALRP